MQPNKNRFEQPEGAKRTTIILEDAERVFIDQLIKDGKELGIKSLFSKLLDIYRKLMIQDWKFPGEYYCGISRVAFVNIELLNILVQNTPKEKFYETGKKMGDILKVSMETTVGVDASKPENWNAVFIRLCVHGFGSLELKDKYLLLKNPFLNEPLIWEGILDGLFSITVETKTSISPFVFEIKSSL